MTEVMPDIQLELKDRLKYTDLIEKSIMNIKSAINSDTININKINTMIMDLLFDIPSSWYDEDFSRDVKSVIKIRSIPNVVMWAGVSLSKEYMEKHDLPMTKEVKEVNYFRLKNAIINLLDRRNMLIRKEKVEQSTGRNLEFETLDDLIESLEVDEKEDEENEET